MADGAVARRDEEPAIHRLAEARWTGIEAVMMRGDPGLHRGAALPVDRIGFHIGAPVRAECAIEDVRQSGWQCRGNFDLLPAGSAGWWDDETPAELISVRFQPATMARAAARLGLSGPRARLTPRIRLQDPYVELIVWALKAEIDAGHPSPGLYGEVLGDALAARLLACHSGARRPNTGGLTSRQLRQVVELVEAEIDRDLTLAELAAAAGVSVSHFTAMFRRSMGQSAHRYLVERRVLRAQTLLAGRLGIAEVAAATGFAHPSHLARWMRRMTGLTPSAFARTH